MRGIIGASLAALLSLVALPGAELDELTTASIGQGDRRFTPIPSGEQLAMFCYYTGEQLSGMNKICYYNCAGSAAAITISAVQLCPMQIQG
jgi:hypothetical protein